MAGCCWMILGQQYDKILYYMNQMELIGITNQTNIINNNSCVKQEKKELIWVECMRFACLFLGWWKMSVGIVADTLLYLSSSFPSFLMKYCNQRNSVGFNRISAGVNLTGIVFCDSLWIGMYSKEFVLQQQTNKIVTAQPNLSISWEWPNNG